ncbi:GAF domain-containing protein [Vallitalea guaymasensis]|uniref:GAF domain-containing protein n=1 Tax=Vallitalea guaymasensis TaxID=1185412 RepID=A0A8J8MBY1_9FIRM|nr:GAF domain-containing protein [Vallitalea guaymasensis]QUH30078.1 GAF domain-containing protein [Vallitalea guaymasensis]
MAYEQMLYNILEHHRKNEDISKKVYRYTGLIHAIEFFSQKFNLDHIEKYIFEFTNELLLPNQIAVFIRKNHEYKLMQVNGYDKEQYTIKYNESFDEIIKYNSGLLRQNNLKTYFSKDIFSDFECNFIMPLIMDCELYGFIFVNRNNEEFLEDDEIIANALMNLFSTSLSNYKYFKELENVSKQLNEKLFSLFAINHSSKALLSSLDLGALYRLSISAFAELTQSSFTTFFLYDSISNSYKLMSLKDVYNSSSVMFINLYPTKSIKDTKIRILTDMSNESQRNQFYDLFEDSREILKDVKISYVVSLLKKNRLVGFVTLGPKVNGNQYENSVFELIESLASSTYIAINNAKNFQKTNMQKEIINNKLTRLVKLNELMKNINIAGNMEQLIDLTLSTLSVFFGVTSGFIGLYDNDKDGINITRSINIDGNLTHIPLQDELLPLKLGEKIILNSEADVENTFAPEIVECFNDTYSGALFVPIFVDENELKLLGVIGILAIKDKILGDEENIITLESIANHIAPIMYQFISLSKIIDQYRPDYQAVFLNDLKQDVIEAEEFYLELKIIHIEVGVNFTFTRINTDKLRKQFEKVYPVDNMNIFVISFDKEPVNDIISILGENISCKQYDYGKDFNSFEEFVSIYS